MKLVTRDTDYALRALCYMAGCQDRVVPASELVRELGIPRPFLRKILQVLHKRKVLKSYRGQGGGFLFMMPPDKIFLFGLIEIFQGRLRLNDCFFKKMVCPNTGRCILKKKIDGLERYILKELSSITVASLTSKTGNG